jgi:hypothetical protein
MKTELGDLAIYEQQTYYRRISDGQRFVSYNKICIRIGSTYKDGSFTINGSLPSLKAETLSPVDAFPEILDPSEDAKKRKQVYEWADSIEMMQLKEIYKTLCLVHPDIDDINIVHLRWLLEMKIHGKYNNKNRMEKQ